MKKISILPLWGLSRFFLPALVFCVLLAACPNPSGGSEGVYSAVPPDSAKGITAFTFTSPPVTGTIDDTAKTVVALVPPGTALTNLVPDITVSADARVSPGSGEARDFSAPVTYTVTGVDASIQIWTVTVQWGPFNNIVDMWNYLSESSANPVPLPVSINLADLSGNGWTDLLSAINAEGKNVALDLSACTMDVSSSGVMEFDLGTDAVGKDKIVSLVLPDEAESIKAGTYGRPIFQNFTALTELSGKNVKTIGDRAFFNCDSLIAVELPAATTIGVVAFSGCANLETVEFPAAAIIGVGAFSDCAKLKTVEFPAATIIGGSAFSGCANLETVELPAVRDIGQEAFWDCTSLAEVYLPVVRDIGQYAFSDCTNLETVEFPAARAIGQYAFSGCTKLETVELPVAASIATGAFLGCTSIGIVNFPAAIVIGEAAFAGCTNLVKVDLPAATGTGMAAFSDCTKLETVDLSAVIDAGWVSFAGCTSLTTLKFPALPPKLIYPNPDGPASHFFGGTGSVGTLYIVVPPGKVGDYTSDWGVLETMPAGDSKYGLNHKTITITDNPSP